MKTLTRLTLKIIKSWYKDREAPTSGNHQVMVKRQGSHLFSLLCLIYRSLIFIAVKPEDRPSVTGFKTRHRVGDTLQMTCYINNTFPAANLTWFVTGKRVRHSLIKVETILKGSLDVIPSPSPSVKIQIVGEKVCLRCKNKTLLGVVNNVLPYYFK